jgi:hypothetical protein
MAPAVVGQRAALVEGQHGTQPGPALQGAWMLCVMVQSLESKVASPEAKVEAGSRRAAVHYLARPHWTTATP